MTKEPQRHRVRCEIDGKTHNGNYWVAGKILVVSTAMGGMSTQLGAALPETLARQLLLKLAQAGKA